MKIPIDQAAVAVEPCPSTSQVRWQRGELSLFVHFTVNTYTGREWGDGTESPSIFNPTDFDADQWAAAARDAGASHMILTAKHHDGFCLWPSAYTDHSVKASPWRNGQGDVVREFSDACRRHGLGVGLYLSPWDRHERTYGDSPAYNRFYLNQLQELLTQYGELTEIWFDGACGEGLNGRRQVYDWEAIFDTCRRLQPQAMTFGDGGTTVRWNGNERGIAGDPNWSIVDSAVVRFPGDAGNTQANDARAASTIIHHHLQHGNADGSVWRVAESNVSIRPGWFYHAHEDGAVRCIQNLVELWFASVGRNSHLLLNIPPTPAGLFHETDVARLRALGDFRRQLVATDLAADGRVVRRDDKTWELQLPEVREFDVVSLAEPIELGQRVAAYRIYILDEHDQWQWLTEAHTIGCRKLDRSSLVRAKALRIEVTRSRATPLLSEIALHRCHHPSSLP